LSHIRNTECWVSLYGQRLPQRLRKLR